jgi:hypothetical protein
MKNLRNLITAAGLMAVLVMGAISANAGVLLADRSVNTDPCSTNTKQDEGIILSDIVDGVIMHLTGVIMHRDGVIMHKDGDVEVNCGVIMH